jgi:hypothetical protein
LIRRVESSYLGNFLDSVANTSTLYKNVDEFQAFTNNYMGWDRLRFHDGHPAYLNLHDPVIIEYHHRGTFEDLVGGAIAVC